MDVERLKLACDFAKGIVPILIYMAMFIIPFLAWAWVLDYALPRFFPKLYKWFLERMGD